MQGVRESNVIKPKGVPRTLVQGITKGGGPKLGHKSGWGIALKRTDIGKEKQRAAKKKKKHTAERKKTPKRTTKNRRSSGYKEGRKATAYSKGKQLKKRTGGAPKERIEEGRKRERLELPKVSLEGPHTTDRGRPQPKRP